MNIQRGFFRIWVVLSGASIAIVFLFSYNEIKNEFTQLTSHDIPVECSMSRGKIGQDFYALDKTIAPVPDGFELQNSSNQLQFNYLISDNICWYHPAKFRDLYSEYKDLSDDAVRKKLYQKAGLKQTEPHPWKKLFNMFVNATIFPLITLGLWFVASWIFAGFRGQKST
jgi:hypothetical protein